MAKIPKKIEDIYEFPIVVNSKTPPNTQSVGGMGYHWDELERGHVARCNKCRREFVVNPRDAEKLIREHHAKCRGVEGMGATTPNEWY